MIARRRWKHLTADAALWIVCGVILGWAIDQSTVVAIAAVVLTMRCTIAVEGHIGTIVVRTERARLRSTVNPFDSNAVRSQTEDWLRRLALAVAS